MPEQMVSSVWQVLFVSGCLGIAVSDLTRRKTPNPLLLALLAVHVLGLWGAGLKVMPTALDPSEWQQALLGFLVPLALCWPLWRMRVMGAGDAKWLAVLGAVVGLTGLVPIFLLGSVLAGVHALALVLLRGYGLLKTEWHAGLIGRRGIPYAAHLSIAALAWAYWLAPRWGTGV